ncbi:MAG: MMPL family transporter [Nitrospiraceae bacterium]|nr:MMPL family transporter [Nitrospiraceae bacterium]
MTRLLGAFIRNRVFANIATIVILFAGGVSIMGMIREFFPEISTDRIAISVLYPGADPEEVEEGISRKVEEAVESIEGIKQYYTISNENKGTTIIEVLESYDLDEVYDRVRNAVDSISTFPRDAEKPIISEITFREQVLFLVLWGDQTERTFKEMAEQVKDELQRLPELSQVSVIGARDYEVSIELSEERLRQYGLTFSQVASAVRRGSLNLSSGVIRTKGQEIRLRTVGRKYTGEDFAKIVVLARPTGEVITLDRIADIRDGFTDDPIYATFNGKPCVMLACFKTSEEDAIAIGKAARAYAKKKQLTLPEGANISVMADNTYVIEGRLNLMRRNGTQGLIIVVILLWLLLGRQLSFWVSLGIPISFAGALAIMNFRGDTLNMLSLFGLIMVLGMVVDDAIVVGEAIHFHRQAGLSPKRAALKGVMEVGIPVLGAVTTTIVAFLPLLFVGGIMGKFIRIIPIAVIACLVISLFESLFLLPAHLSDLPDPNRDLSHGMHPFARRLQKFQESFARGLESFIERVYGPIVTAAVHHRYISMCVALSTVLLTAGLIMGGFVMFEVFPKIDGNDLIVDIEFPDGTPIEVTQAAVRHIEAAARRLEAKTTTASGEPLYRNLFTVSGQGGIDFERRNGTYLGQMHLELLKSEARGVSSIELTAKLEDEIGTIPGIVSQTIQGFSAGPPGAAIEVWLQGEDLNDLVLAAAELKDKLRTYDGVYQISDDYRPGKSEIKIDIKPEGRTLGIELQDLAFQVYAGFFGEEAARIQRGRDDVRVRVRYTEDERRTLAELDRMRIRTRDGHEVPFFSVADVSFGPGYSTITRLDGLRRVSVSAEVDTGQGANAEMVLADLSKTYMPGLEQRHPGLVWSYQGAQKNSREALDSLKIGFPIALLVILVIIASIFRSYLQPLAIMVTVPFGILGAIYGHLLLGFTVTLMSLFGIVALAGVVVNDAIVLVDCLNRLLRDGVPFFDALVRAGKRRFRAIILTTATTMGGLGGIILERDLQAQFLKPMAISLAAGIAFATVLTLLLLPSLLAVLNDLRRLWAYARTGRWPTPEEVEPSTCEEEDIYHNPENLAEPATAAVQEGH